ncbi:hypothetical protein AOX55_00005241 (plasmid) [Sinorhizobium fredii CCBAU 25509]|nr:hypothetical protein AOX55_00005241 [Sinorhizobium fredii CCBAU 25509]
MFSPILSYQQFWRGVGSARLAFQSATATLARPIGRASL